MIDGGDCPWSTTGDDLVDHGDSPWSTTGDGTVENTAFSGWMIASSPALNALDNPRYDVWLLRCNNS